MTIVSVALSIFVLALLALLLWFVPHVLQQQATRMASETTQLREMLLDILNEQEAMTNRQSQLGTSLARLQDQLNNNASAGDRAPIGDHQVSRAAENVVQQREARQRAAQDNEGWANLMGLLASIQERVGALSQDRDNVMAGLRAGALVEELEQEMQNLRGVSEEIAMLQWRLRRSIHERESNVSVLRARTITPDDRTEH